MSVFEYRGSELFVEGVSVQHIAAQFGTPTYIYSRQAITQAFMAYANALGDHPGTICYAVKANSNIGILNVLARLGAGFDIVSVGELERVLKAGGDPAKVVFSGVGKKAEEMARALEVGVACFNVESESELELLSQVASAQNKMARISLRVNPDVDAKTHPYISTGLKENKFGIAFGDAVRVYLKAASLPGIQIKGVDCHIGSQLTDVRPFLDALDKLLGLIDELAGLGIAIHHLDLGGGLGITYNKEQVPEVSDYIASVKQKLGDRKLALMFEPGRSIVATAGGLLMQVLYLKPTPSKNFAVVDAAMNDNIRPSLYQAYQPIIPVNTKTQAVVGVWDIVGPVCETGDFFGKERELAVAEGDLLMMMCTGAYGFTMSSNYNTRPRAAEVLVDGTTMHCVRKRETVADCYAHEAVLPA